MFCAKCGTQLSEMDAECPKCGAPNINYTAPRKKITYGFKSRTPNESDNAETKKIKFRPPLVIAAATVVAVLVVGIAWGKTIIRAVSGNDSGIVYTSRGTRGYLDQDGNACFIEGTEVISFPGPAVYAYTSPDHTRYLVRYDDDRLLSYTGAEDTGETISENASSVQTCSNNGVYYLTESGEESCEYYYSFSNKETIELGQGDYTYSSHRTAVAGLDDNGTLSLYVEGNDGLEELCTVDEEADICCVADDGSNVIWSVQSGSTYSVYMMENGMPERIGKINNSEKYSSVRGYFFNDGASFLVYSHNGSQIILGHDGAVTEISLPGLMTSNGICDAEGKTVDSDDDTAQTFYLSVYKTTSSSTKTLYQLTLDGALVSVVEGINADASYKLSGGELYYLNIDNDLMRTNLDDATTSDLITTDVDSLQLSANGKYAFIEKSGGLYVWSTADKSFCFDMITSRFDENSKFYLTNQDDVIYFITDMADVTKYRKMGTAYRYSVGEEPEQISQSILYFSMGNQEYVDADAPIIVKYASTDEGSNDTVDYGSIVDADTDTPSISGYAAPAEETNIMVDYGSVVDGAYQTLIAQVENQY